MNHDLTTHAGQISHYAAVRARIAAAAYKPQKPKISIEDEPEIKDDDPIWLKEKTYFDDHVNRWRMRVVYTPMDWLRDRCKELDVGVHFITGPQRNKAISRLRFQLVWEMNERFQLSLPQIGRIFGGRDHTTIINALARWEAMRHEND